MAVQADTGRTTVLHPEGIAVVVVSDIRMLQTQFPNEPELGGHCREELNETQLESELESIGS
jgi:hypothetical protein